MPYLSSFETDLFINYSSIDNKPLMTGQHGWITGFQKALRNRLAIHLGAEATVSGDRESPDQTLAVSDPRAAAVLVSVVSPAYVGSENCHREVREFFHAARNGGFSPDDEPRVFKVVKLPVPSERQLPEILRLLNYEFYQIDPESGHPRELNPEVNPNVRQNYWLKLDDLAFDIHVLLEKLKSRTHEKLPGVAEPEVLAEESRPVFISYASQDEEKAKTICSLLEQQGINCWIAVRDAKLGDHYGPQLIDAIDRASILVLVLSSRSNASLPVNNEVEFAANGQKPIYTVRIEDVNPSKRLAFHVAGREWLNAWVTPMDRKIDRLADRIREELGLRKGDESVYLAETTFDLSEERDGIKRELKERGYNVLPDRNLPGDLNRFSREVEEYLNRSRLSVHLIGDNYGDMPKGASQSLVQLQIELAAARRRSDPRFSSLMWIPPGLEARDQNQGMFINKLQNDRACDQQVELLNNSLEELKSVIEETLTDRRQPPPTTSAGDPLYVYLICDQQDRAAVLPLRNYLYDRGHEAVLPAMTGDEAEVREDHKENLLMCDACLIYYGAANEFWLRSKLRDLQKSAGYGRNKPLLAKAIYIAAPETPDKINFLTLDALLISNFETFQADKLQPFLAKLERTRTMKGGR